MPLQKTCIICHQIFLVKPSHFNDRFCCSRKCQGKSFEFKMKGNNNPNWKNNKTKQNKICPTCGKEFIGYTEKYCSYKCNNVKKRYCLTCNKRLPVRYYKKECVICRIKNVYVPPKKYKDKPRCRSCKKIVLTRQTLRCKSCHIKWQGRNKRIVKCINCKKEIILHNCKFIHSRKKEFCCSRKCRIIMQIGNKNGNWKGGVTSINKQIRYSNKSKEWRIKIFENDNYTCQTEGCGQKGGKLQAHHIKPFCYYP